MVPGDDDDKAIIDRRQSIAYFCNVNADAIVRPIDGGTVYEPVVAKDYLLAKHLTSMSSSKEAAATTTTTTTKKDEL